MSIFPHYSKIYITKILFKNIKIFTIYNFIKIYKKYIKTKSVCIKWYYTKLRGKNVK